MIALIKTWDTKEEKKFGWNKNTFDFKHAKHEVSVQFPGGAVYCWLNQFIKRQ